MKYHSHKVRMGRSMKTMCGFVIAVVMIGKPCSTQLTRLIAMNMLPKGNPIIVFKAGRGLCEEKIGEDSRPARINFAERLFR